jgi:hypothetical protein
MKKIISSGVGFFYATFEKGCGGNQALASLIVKRQKNSERL